MITWDQEWRNNLVLDVNDGSFNRYYVPEDTQITLIDHGSLSTITIVEESVFEDELYLSVRTVSGGVPRSFQWTFAEGKERILSGIKEVKVLKLDELT